MAHEARQDDGAEVAAAVGRQRLLAAGIRRRNRLAVAQVVVRIDVVQKQNAGLGEVIGRTHHGVPHLARRHGLVDPQAVCALEGAPGHQRGAGFGLVDQLPRLVVVQRLHEAVRHAHGHVEVVPAAGRALGGDELVHIGVVDAQHAHLGAAPRAGAFHRRARLVKHVHVAARAGGHRRGGLDLGAARADARKVVAHAAAAPHGLGGLAQGLVNAGVAAIIDALNAVADRLHEAVDQRGLDGRARSAHDAARANRAGVQVFEEQRLVLLALGFRLDRSQGPRHAPVHVLQAGFARLQVFFPQHVVADGLGGGQVLRPAEMFALHGCCSSKKRCRANTAGQPLHRFLERPRLVVKGSRPPSGKNRPFCE